MQLFLADQIMAKLFSIYFEYQPISSGIKKVELKILSEKMGPWRSRDKKLRDRPNDILVLK